MTIELVAMLFDFIFETKDLPDGIKALLARLQIPVLKAAMLDGAFFAKKNHPSRLLVNALAEAGRGWTPVMGTNDPLYSHIDALVHRILDGFTDDLTIFDEAREKLERFLADEEQAAEANIQSTAEEIDQHDRREMAEVVAKSEIERRIEMYPVPNFLAWFLRQQWILHAAGRLPLAGRGKRDVGAEHRDARGPRLERAAEEAPRTTASISWRCCPRCSSG